MKLFYWEHKGHFEWESVECCRKAQVSKLIFVKDNGDKPPFWALGCNTCAELQVEQMTWCPFCGKPCSVMEMLEPEASFIRKNWDKFKLRYPILENDSSNLFF